MEQKIKHIKSKDGTQLAYATVGKGPPLVKTATYITHLEHDWQNSIWRPFLTGLSRYHTLIRYDERGCGLSDWYARDYSWESWVEDLKAVVDAEGLAQFDLFGQSQGSTVAVAFAARYPERVRKLIIFGGYARGWLHRDLNEEEKKMEQFLIDMIKIGWGKDNPSFRQFFSSQLMPGASQEKIHSFNELMRISTEPEIAAQLERNMHRANVVDEAPKVKCPTLILHSMYDASIPFKEGKILAELIPGSRFVRLDTNNHVLQDNEPAWTQFWEEVYRFLDVKEDFSKLIQPHTVNGERILRTILITDIVESTRMAMELGDEKWIHMLEMHNETVRNSVSSFHGEVIKDTGDGFLLIFESPSYAVDCAKDLIRNFEDTPVSIRCGIHTGEVEKIQKDVRGVNVHIASRVLSVAGSNEIWTTSVVKDLALGSHMNFEFTGEYEFKGIPEKKRLFKAVYER